jgi:hypothetical protein
MSMRLSVTPEKAETTTAGTFPAWSLSFKIPIMLPIAPGLPTEVPPNFRTSMIISRKIGLWYYIFILFYSTVM